MKVIIAGSRGIDNVPRVDKAIRGSNFDISEIVSGVCSNSPDMAGIRWAALKNIPVRKFPANWKKHGRSAGAIRNVEMANYADALIAIWDGQSKGTQHMITIAKRKGLEVFVCL